MLFDLSTHRSPTHRSHERIADTPLPPRRFLGGGPLCEQSVGASHIAAGGGGASRARARGGGAQQCLEDLATGVAVPITSIAIRECPKLPATTEAIIADARAAGMADSAMYREALASAAKARGWSVYWYDRDAVSRAAAAALGSADLDTLLRSLGKSVGPPWTAKHKLAAAGAIAASVRK